MDVKIWLLPKTPCSIFLQSPLLELSIDARSETLFVLFSVSLNQNKKKSSEESPPFSKFQDWKN